MTIVGMAHVDRALLVSEWAAGSRAIGSIGGARCPSCGAREDDGKHDQDCPHDLALCERSYPDQASRNRARELLAQAGAVTIPPPGSTS